MQEANQNNVHNIDEAKTQGQQVFMCTLKTPDSDACQSQNYVMLDDGLIMCMRCHQQSSFTWWIPEQVPMYLRKRIPREKDCKTLPGHTIHVCRECSGIEMHLYEHGTVHCIRCKKQTAARFGNEAEL